MDKIVITLSPGNKNQIEIVDYPELASDHRLVAKGIAVLKQYMPGVMRYLSMQRLLGRLPHCLIAARAGDMTEAEVRSRLTAWLRRKRLRRLFYVILELLLLPFTAFIAVLPGPNVAFYGLFVLFYFHAKALLSLSKIKVEELNITLLQN